MPVVIGLTRQLLFDDYVVRTKSGLKRTVHPCTKHNDGQPVLVPDMPWEYSVCRPAAVIYSGEKNLYEMWYYSNNPPHSLLDIAYACSTDGLTWDKPRFDDMPCIWQTAYFDEIRQYYGRDCHPLRPNLSDEQLRREADAIVAYYQGIGPHNILMAGNEMQGVVYTPEDPDPQQRYKAAHFGGAIMTSPDGIHWRLGNVFYPGQFNQFNYDPAKHLYFGYFMFPPSGVSGPDGQGRRALGFSCSHDLVRWRGLNDEDTLLALPLEYGEFWGKYFQGRPIRDHIWPEVDIAIAPDERDDAMVLERLESHREVMYHPDFETGSLQAHFQGLPVLPYEGVYIGFPVKHESTGHSVAGMKWPEEGIMHAEIAFSRDLRNWQRDDRTVVIPNGAPRTWDGTSVNPANKPLIVGDEVWLYYGNMAWGFGWPPDDPRYLSEEDRPEVERRYREFKIEGPNSGIGIAKWRLDGFVSLDAGAEQGNLTTVPIVFTGRQLEINARVLSGGGITAEIEVRGGEKIEGYSHDQCDAFTGDAVHHIMTWQGNADVGRLAGRTVQLSLRITNAQLFAFQFVGTGPGPLRGPRGECQGALPA